VKRSSTKLNVSNSVQKRSSLGLDTLRGAWKEVQPGAGDLARE
jgi:hypothetical protein